MESHDIYEYLLYVPTDIINIIIEFTRISPTFQVSYDSTTPDKPLMYFYSLIEAWIYMLNDRDSSPNGRTSVDNIRSHRFPDDMSDHIKSIDTKIIGEEIIIYLDCKHYTSTGGLDAWMTFPGARMDDDNFILMVTRPKTAPMFLCEFAACYDLPIWEVGETSTSHIQHNCFMIQVTAADEHSTTRKYFSSTMLANEFIHKYDASNKVISVQWPIRGHNPYFSELTQSWESERIGALRRIWESHHSLAFEVLNSVEFKGVLTVSTKNIDMDKLAADC